MKALIAASAGLLLFMVQAAPPGTRPIKPTYPPPLESGTSSVRGRIVDAESDEPLAGIPVRLFSARPTGARTITTNEDGIYEFAAIAEGAYTVTVESSTYLLPSNLSPVRVVRDQQGTLDLRLVRGAVARGRVVDSGGTPVAGATVRLGRPVRDLPYVPVRPVVTRSDGLFELFPLPAGEWHVEVEPPMTRDVVSSPTVYHPGVVSREEAVAIELTAGLVTDNVTIVVPPISENVLTLHVSSSAGLKDAAVTIIRPTPLMVRRVDLDSDGVGTIKGLLEGRYFVAVSQRSQGKELAAFQAVDFTPNLPEVHLALQPAGRITGRIVAQRGGLPSLEGVRVGAAWVHDDVEINPLVPDNVEAGPDGRFTITGLFGRRKMELGGLSQDWRIQAVLQGRADVTTGVDVPPGSTVDLTIVLARR